MSRDEDLAGARAAIKLLRAWAAEDWERVQLLCLDGCRPAPPMVEHLIAAVAAAACDLGNALGLDPCQVLDGLEPLTGQLDFRRCALREAVMGLITRDRSRFEAGASQLEPFDGWDLTVALAEAAVELYRGLSRLRGEGENVECLVIEAGRRLGVRSLERTV